MEEILRANKRKSCQMETVVTISMEHRLRSMKVELDSRRKNFFSTDGKKFLILKYQHVQQWMFQTPTQVYSLKLGATVW